MISNEIASISITLFIIKLETSAFRALQQYHISDDNSTGNQE